MRNFNIIFLLTCILCKKVNVNSTIFFKETLKKIISLSFSVSFIPISLKIKKVLKVYKFAVVHQMNKTHFRIQGKKENHFRK